MLPPLKKIERTPMVILCYFLLVGVAVLQASETILQRYRPSFREGFQVWASGQRRPSFEEVLKVRESFLRRSPPGPGDGVDSSGGASGDGR